MFFEILCRLHFHDLGAVGLERLFHGVEGEAEGGAGLGVDGGNAVVKGLERQVSGGLAIAEQLHHHIGGGLAQLDVIDAVAHEGTVQREAVGTGVVLDARIKEGLVDGELSGHDRVIGGGEDGLDARSDQGLRGHLDLGGGGAVLFNVLDALAVAERLGIRDGLGGSILTEVVQQTDGVDVRVDREDQVHNGIGVQRIGGAGDVLPAVKTGGRGVGDSGVDHGDIGVLDSSQ